jgi:adenylate cyclase
LSKTSIIKKTRYTVNHKGQIWEIDQFEGDNQGLVIAEIELKQKDEAISLPNWIGTEISNDERFYNLSLSSNPFKNWN